MFYDRPNTISTNSPANQGPFGTLVSFPRRRDERCRQSVRGTRPTRSPLTRSTSRPTCQFFLPQRVVQLRPEPAERPAAVVERHARARDHADVSRARGLRRDRKGDRLAMGRELNAAVFAPGATTATTNQRRPLFPNYSTITTIESTGESTYHALQLTLDKRMSKRFSVLTSYTLSTNKDHAGENKQTGTTQTNPYDLEFDWGYSNADRRHRFVTSFLWQIPGEFDNPVVSSRALRLVAHRHSGHAERLLASPSRAVSTTRAPAPAVSAPTSRAIPTCRPIVPMRRRSSAGSTRRSTRRTRWGRSATPGATICADRGRRTSISACTRRSPRAAAPGCSSASRRSTCSTG